MQKRLSKEELPDVLTLRQASQLLNCRPNTLRNWNNKGVLKALHFGKRRDRRYKKADILYFLKNHNNPTWNRILQIS